MDTYTSSYDICGCVYHFFFFFLNIQKWKCFADLMLMVAYDHRECLVFLNVGCLIG